jgi:hypothetical protein
MTVEKLSVRWNCEACHEDIVTVAWKTRESEDLEPVPVRARCPVCGNVSVRSFRPGTDPNTHESYTQEEWSKRGETERATRHSVDGLPAEPEDETPEGVTDDDLQEFETKADQCQPPHVASTWNLVPPVNEWYAQDVPRLVAEVRRLRAEQQKVRTAAARR